MKKYFIVPLLIVIVIVAGWLMFTKTHQGSSSVDPQPAVMSASTPTSTQSLPAAQASSTVQTQAEHVVTYADDGYSPATIMVKVGETVTWKNQSGKAMWTASGLHPSHLVYPTTGGCIGSTFDACAGIQPGDAWSFTFDITGTWHYHNHLFPMDRGTVTVVK